MKAVLLTLLPALILLAACQTAPAPLAADAPAMIYFQRAQAASDLSQYDEALTIYRAFLTNHPNATREDEFSARYEVALLLTKIGKNAEALTAFEGILADFENLDKSAGAPAWVKVLAEKKVQGLKEKAPKAAS